MTEPRASAPFFVVGAPRTGTTLLRRLLMGHSRVAIPTESGFMVDYLIADDVPLAVKKELLTVEPEIGYWEIRLEPDELAPLESIGACFVFAHEKYAAKHGKDLWGQKTPKLVRHGALLSRHFPGARFLHVVRDGRAVAGSLERSRYHRQHVMQGAQRYAADAREGIALERSMPERVLRVRYEDLVAEPERELRRICDFLVLDWEPAVVEGADDLLLTPRERETGHHDRVGSAVDADRKDGWRQGLSPAKIRIVEHVAGDVMRELGYEVPRVPPPTPRELLDARLHHAGLSLEKAVREVTQREDVWQIARRRWRLGAFRRMVREHVTGM